MKAILFLLLSLIILKANSQNNNNYSIEYFLDYLQNSGYYEVILGIKLSFGNDYAICFCKTYVTMTLHCEEVVVIYMTPITAIPEEKETEDKPPSNNTLQHEIDKIDEMMNYIKQKYLDILLKNNNNDINEVNDKFEKLKNTLIKEFKKNNKYEKNDKYAEYKEINK